MGPLPESATLAIHIFPGDFRGSSADFSPHFVRLWAVKLGVHEFLDSCLPRIFRGAGKIRLSTPPHNSVS